MAARRVMERRQRGTMTVALVCALCAAAPARPQTIRIPDFRQPLAVSTVKAGEPCNDCGRIISIREISGERKAAVPVSFQGAARGPVEHNLVGAVVYLPLASGSGDRPFVGGVGTPEMRERFGETTYEMTLRMDDGTVRAIQRGDGSRFRVGDRVRATGAGALELVVD